MKRGATVIFVHFHSMPYTSQNSVDQVVELVEKLTRYQLKSKLYLIPFAEVQNDIVQKTPPPLLLLPEEIERRSFSFGAVRPRARFAVRRRARLGPP